MRDFDSIEILNTLLDGLDPVTGEVLENDHVCCTGEVMSALYEAVQALEEKRSSSSGGQAREIFRDNETNPSTKLNAGRRWTDEDDQHLKALYLQGAGMEEICQRLMRRPRGARRRMEELGLIYVQSEKPAEEKPEATDNRGKRWSREEHERVIEMWLEDGRITEIAKEIKRTPFAIRCHLGKYGLLETAPGIAPWTEEDTKQLFRMVDRKCTVKEMAEHFGRTEKAIEARLFYLGLSKKAPKLLP